MSASELSVPFSRAAWRVLFQRLRRLTFSSHIVGGSLVMLIGSGLVSAVNFGYNVAIARMLGPAAFGHAAAAVTLLMLVSAITLAFQLVCAKFVARNETAGGKRAVYSLLLRRAWIVGIMLGGALCLASHAVASYLHLPSPTLVILLAAGISFYIPLGAKRGGFQGVCAFSRLTANFIIEVLVKFLGAIVLIHAGYGINGAVGAIAASVVLAYFLPFTPRELNVKPEPAVPASFSEGMQAIVFFVGQVVINNVDILLVKHFFAPTQAGLYAAVALVGRVLYMLSWSVVSAMFPISAGAKRNENASVLIVPLLFVVVIALVFTLGLGLFPDVALRAIFGDAFRQTGQRLDPLLMLYAAATGVYSLSVVLMAYEMSRRLANCGWVQLFFSGAIVLGIGLFHSTLRQVVVVQLVIMVFLLIVSALPFFYISTSAAAAETQAAAGPLHATLRRRRRVPEAEVIAEFLRNEFHHTEFNRDRRRFQDIVLHADVTNEAENALRRALLFRRRGTMWRELPPDTEWFEVELSSADIQKLRVFPRAQWRKLASGSFVLSDIVDRVRASHFTGRTGEFVKRIQRFSEQLKKRGGGSGILLIGVNEEQPLTVIEGNHRVTAGALVSAELVRQRFRFYCGFSPHMTECCWYQTNLATLYRYARNRLKIIRFDRETEIARLLTLHAGPNEISAAETGSADDNLEPAPETEMQIEPRRAS
jgi:O-antigen/teichoic acid export membrane protein